MQNVLLQMGNLVRRWKYPNFKDKLTRVRDVSTLFSLVQCVKPLPFVLKDIVLKEVVLKTNTGEFERTLKSG